MTFTNCMVKTGIAKILGSEGLRKVERKEWVLEMSRKANECPRKLNFESLRILENNARQSHIIVHKIQMYY